MTLRSVGSAKLFAVLSYVASLSRSSEAGHVAPPVCDASIPGNTACGNGSSSSSSRSSSHTRGRGGPQRPQRPQHQQGESLPPTCGLYLAESKSQRGPRYALYNGHDARSADEALTTPDVVIPIYDPNKNEWSPWHDFIWDGDLLPATALENKHLMDIFMPGCASLGTCAQERHQINIVGDRNVVMDHGGVHRSVDLTVGAFAYHYKNSYRAMHSLLPGEKLLLSCASLGPESDLSVKGHAPPRPRRSLQELDWLEENAVCIDHNNLAVKESSLRVGGSSIGRGVFATRPIGKNQVITSTPMLHFDRSQMDIVSQEVKTEHLLPLKREHGIEYSDEIVGKQLLLNYCYGHPDSNVLLLPLAPAVSFVNHDRKKANACIRWSRTTLDDAEDLLEMTPHELLDQEGMAEGVLVMEFVALRDIQPGHEIFIDYGDDWKKAMEEHTLNWEPHDDSYVSAGDFMKRDGADTTIRTAKEQLFNPYPSNIQTACYFSIEEEDEEEESAADIIIWDQERLQCLRPCDVIERKIEDSSGGTFYSARVYPTGKALDPDYCGTAPSEGLIVRQIPAKAVTLVDEPYTSDVHLRNTFRHEIGVPESFFPTNWMAADPEPFGDFIANPLGPNQIAPIRWAENAEEVTPWAFRIGLDKQIREVLLDYCDKTGITAKFRYVTEMDNGLEPGKDTPVTVNGMNWFMQRPANHWQSNLHWLSPLDNASHEDYLQALSVAGFDEVLQSISAYLNMDGLVVFHVTFIAVSRSTKGYMHYDVQNTGGKAYNIIVPLILANETGPELDLQEEGDHEEGGLDVGRYRYEYDVASMMGDYAYHATSAVDYRTRREMRMAATVYIADVNEANIQSIMSEYTQAYPPQDRALLQSWAGRHWRKDDPNVKLPRPKEDHILLSTRTTSEKQ